MVKYLVVVFLVAFVAAKPSANTTTTQAPTTSSGPTTTRDPRCPTNEDKPTYLPHEKNCWQFYECSGGFAKLLTCPKGLYFNPPKSVCDDPENVDCGKLSTTTGAPTTTTPKTPSTSK